MPSKNECIRFLTEDETGDVLLELDGVVDRDFNRSILRDHSLNSWVFWTTFKYRTGEDNDLLWDRLSDINGRATKT